MKSRWLGADFVGWSPGSPRNRGGWVRISWGGSAHPSGSECGASAISGRWTRAQGEAHVYGHSGIFSMKLHAVPRVPFVTQPAPRGRALPRELPYFGLGLGAFLALYLPQPLLLQLD